MIKVVNEEERACLYEYLDHVVDDLIAVRELYEIEGDGDDPILRISIRNIQGLMDNIVIADTENKIGEIKVLVEAGASDEDICKEVRTTKGTFHVSGATVERVRRMRCK